jgi:CHASE3 domain sensor protein
MIGLVLDPQISRRELLEQVIEAERNLRALLEEAAAVTADQVETDLYTRLAERQAESLRELAEENDRLGCEEFIEGAMGDV